MKKLLLASVMAVLPLSAFAADLPARKSAPEPIYAAPIFTWTGFYVGAQVGGAWTKDKTTEYTAAGVATGFGGSNNASGIIGGLHVGYNFGFGGPFVLGLEGDLEGAGLSKSNNCQVNLATGVCLGGAYSYNAKIDWQGSIRGRLGYAMGPALFYVTGGWAFADYKTTYVTGAASASFSSVQSGWTLGGGLEYAFAPNWTARVEYRYSDFGRITDAIPAGGPATFAGFSERHKLTEQAVRVGISYKFGGPASAVVAKY